MLRYQSGYLCCKGLITHSLNGSELGPKGEEQCCWAEAVERKKIATRCLRLLPNALARRLPTRLCCVRILYLACPVPNLCRVKTSRCE